jgi:hypothetical protein
MIDLNAMAQAAIHLFQQNQPWLEDKLGGAVVTQGIKELWEQAKAKLGAAATAKVESKPDDTTQWEVLKAKLLVALDEDEVFREKMQALSQGAAFTVLQQAIGDGNKQVSVTGSQNVRVDVEG